MNKLIVAQCLAVMLLTLSPMTQADNGDAAVRLFNATLSLAKKGDEQSQYSVADMYERGVGTDQNFDMAKHWYTQAAAQGSSRAKDKLSDWDRTIQEALKRDERNRAETDKARQVMEAQEAARARAAAEAAARARAAEEAAAKERAAATRGRPAPRPAHPPAPAAQPAAPASAAKAKAKEDEFSTNPCNGPSAKFLSTCK